MGGATITTPNPSSRSLAIGLALLLAVASAVAEWLVWSLFGGFDGCGASFNATSRWVFGYAPFFFLALAATIVTVAGVAAKWRGRTVVLAVVTAVGVGALLEALVFLAEFGAHRCGE